VVLFFLRRCGMYWVIPPILATRDRVGFLCGCMNLGGNIAGISVPIIVGSRRLNGSWFRNHDFARSAVASSRRFCTANVVMNQSVVTKIDYPWSDRRLNNRGGAARLRNLKLRSIRITAFDSTARL
jgi:hypothetical protein